MLDWQSGLVGAEVYGHFLISFTISGLIALIYSYCAMQYLVLRVLYPALWTEARDSAATAWEELRGTRGRLVRFQLLAVLIPLVAATLMLGLGASRVALPGLQRRVR